jgi:hypothetical protein
MNMLGKIESNIIQAIVCSTLDQGTKKEKKSLENKIYSLLDAVLFNISSSYRTARTKFANQFMAWKANSEKIKMPLDGLKVAYGNLDVEGLIEINPKIEEKAEDLKRFGEIDVEGLAEINLEIEEKAEDHRWFGEIDVEGLAEVNPEIEEKAIGSEKKEALNQYWAESAAALAPYILLYQDQAEFAKNLKKFSKMDVEGLTDINPEIEEKAEDYRQFAEIDVEGLAEINSEIEKKATQYEKEKLLSWFRSEEFKRDLVENPGALAGFITFLQGYANESGEINDILRVLKATLWDEANGFSLPE